MDEAISIKTEGFDELRKKLTIEVPSMIRGMAFTIDASVAALARKEEDAEASSLQMGQLQQKPILETEGENKGKPTMTGYHPFKKYSKWSSTSGWVSTTRKVKKGPRKRQKTVPMSMGHFSWAQGTKFRQDSVTAVYGNRLANLWANPTKSYDSRSPLVGRKDFLRTWGKEQSRPSRYNWSKTASIIAGMSESAIAKTERQFAKQIREL
jgi:hypothetical protein